MQFFLFLLILELGQHTGFSQAFSRSHTCTLYFLSCKDRGELLGVVVWIHCWIEVVVLYG